MSALGHLRSLMDGTAGEIDKVSAELLPDLLERFPEIRRTGRVTAAMVETRIAELKAELSANNAGGDPGSAW